MLSVEHEIQESLLEKVSIDLNRGQIGREAGAHHDPLGCRLRLGKVAQLIDERVDVRELELQILDSREPQEVFENRQKPPDLVPEPLHTLEHTAVARRFRILKILKQQIEVQR